MGSTQGKSQSKPTAKAKAPAKETKTRASRRRAPSSEAIAKRAYELSLARADGDHVGHWLAAERELTAS